MAASYRYVLDDSVVENLLTLPARHREQFVIFFRRLAGDPFQSGESSFRDLSRREIQRAHFGQWLVSFWADHAVKELRIVGIQRFKR